MRPTSDKVRQAIFNVLAHNNFGTGFEMDSALVADLFAGTGALGIEALSRGAAFALFVEDAAESRALIRENVEALHLTGVTKIWRRDATDLGPMSAGAGGPFDLALLDPPYRKNLVAPRAGCTARRRLARAERADRDGIRRRRTRARKLEGLHPARPSRVWRYESGVSEEIATTCSVSRHFLTRWTAEEWGHGEG